MNKVVTYHAAEIAKYFIHIANRESKHITNKKLQKLLYYAQAWSVTARQKPLFRDKIEAWVHGPAIRSVYLKYKSFGFAQILQVVAESELSKITIDDKKFLDEVCTVYGKFDSSYLEQLTHSEKPWLDAREGLEAHVGSENEITHVSMEEFYATLLKQ